MNNVIEINIPNGVSITVMALIGAVLVAAIRKAVKGKRGAPATSGPAFTGG